MTTFNLRQKKYDMHHCKDKSGYYMLSVFPMNDYVHRCIELSFPMAFKLRAANRLGIGLIMPK